MGDDDREVYKALKQINREHRAEEIVVRLMANSNVLDEAVQLAKSNALLLRKHSDFHFSLTRLGQWRINLYPSNQRVYPKSKNAPFLKLPFDWTVLDAVNTAIESAVHDKT